MKRFILLLFLVPLAAVPRWCGDWEVGVEALYWRPCMCSFDFAARQVSGGGTSVKTNVGVMPDYDWGIRGLVGYTSEDHCNFALFDFTYIRIADSKSIRGDLIRAIGIAGDFDRTDGWLKHRYNRVNLRFGHRFYEGCRVGLFSYAGGRFVDIQRKEKVRAFSGHVAQTKLRERTKFTGGGFELGFKGTYELGCGFGVAANLGGLAVLGRQKIDLCRGTKEIVQIDPRTQSAFGVDVRGGINYCTRLCWVKLIGEVGYELNYYFGALAVKPEQLNVGITELVGSVATPCIDAGFGGLYLSLKVLF